MADRINFYLDEHVPKAVREGLRADVESMRLQSKNSAYRQQKARGTLSEQFKTAA